MKENYNIEIKFQSNKFNKILLVYILFMNLLIIHGSQEMLICKDFH